MTLTPKQLRQVVPTLSEKRSAELVDKITYVCPRYGLDNPDTFHEFVANLAHESWGFRKKEENLSYTAERIVQTWPTRFKTVAEAKPFARNPKELAKKVYNGRMGNIYVTDGWNMRGGGFMQLTGRDMYEAYRKYTAFDTVENVANAVRTDDYYALDSACWVFSVVKGLNKLALADDMKTIVKRINGGYNGLADRMAYYERAKLYIK